jgi:predicted AAA+ superfamily ATPase
VTEKMVDNLEHRKDHQGEIHPSDSLEEKISLSDRFGLRLHFYSFSQDEYLTAVSQWVKSFGFAMNDSVRDEALHWATEHGSRSGRIALQFARDYAGRTLLKNEKLL